MPKNYYAQGLNSQFTALKYFVINLRKVLQPRLNFLVKKGAFHYDQKNFFVASVLN